MKLSRDNRELFAADRWQRRGMTHWAKAVGCVVMRFSRGPRNCVRKAEEDARRIARAGGFPQYPPQVQSGEL